MTTLVLQPDAAAGKDCFLESGNPTYNGGVVTTMLGTSGVGLLEFDLSSISTTATVSSATLYIYHAGTLGATPFTLSFWSIAAANGAWIEGTRNGALALAGEPCWDALAEIGRAHV